MPIDPRSVTWDAPAGVTWDDDKKEEMPWHERLFKNVSAGLVRGAGSIGATLMAPHDMLNDALMGAGKTSRNQERRQGMDAALAGMGAETDSLAYGGGKLAGEIAGTAGVGPALAGLGRAVPALSRASPLLDSIATAGFRSGGLTGLPGAASRAAGGAITGGAAAGLVDPEYAATGAGIGAVMPGALQAVGKAGNVAGQALRGGGVSPEVAALAQRAEDLGIRIPADRLVNSKPLDALASGLNYMPFSGRAATESAMAADLNRAGSRLMGQNTTNMNKALRDASTVLGSKFDSTLRNNGVRFDQQLLQDVSDVFNTAQKELGSDSLKAISSQVDELTAKGATGVIDGQVHFRDPEMIRQIESKVVNRLRQVTAAIKQMPR